MSVTATATKLSQEKSYYSELTNTSLAGMTEFAPEDFQPTRGTVLAVLAPSITETPGGLVLPKALIVESDLARVCAVPIDAPDCPVKPGDFIVTRQVKGNTVPFARRTDMKLFQYTQGPDSDIIGIIPQEVVAERYGEL